MSGEVRPIEFRLLGPPEVLVRGRVLPIGSLQQRAILVALLLARDAVVPSDELVDVVWGDDPPASATSTLRGLVWRLRKRLAVVDVEGRDDGYRLVAGDERVDARRFDRLVAQGRRASERNQTEAAAAAFGEALSLWRGPALGPLASWPFARAEATRLDEARLDAVEDLAEAELALGRAASAVGRLEPIVRDWPLRERTVGQLMVGLYRAGRQADALAAYQTLRRTLADELGLIPTAALRDLEAAILRQSDELLAPAPAPVEPGRRPVRDNLPVPLTAFIGRARELAELRELVAANRLVTLAGPGGSGKTRMALEVATAMRDRFPDGVWLVELAPVSDGALVARTIAAGVGLLVGELARSGQSLEAALAERPRSRRLLIVLDNCEQVIDATASAAHALLGSCPALTVLATSREPLAVTGEVVFSVPPLSLPPDDAFAVGPGGVDSLQAFDAVALFCARAHDADRNFSLSEANAEAVVRICRRLDGLPLALELAAARARAFGTKEMAEHLDDRFAMLGEGPRTGPPRHQTLRAAMDWSHELLSPAEQAVFYRLAVFPGTFDLNAVRAVAGTDAVAPFTRLMDKSLVAVTTGEPNVRYHLSESVRAYAADQLAAAGGTAEAQRSHRDAFLAIAVAIVADEQRNYSTREHFCRLDSDYANFMAALEWSWTNGDHDGAVHLCAALRPYWYHSAHPEGCHWMERAAGVPVSSPAMVPIAADTRAGLAHLLRNFGGNADGRAKSLIAEAIEVAEAGGDAFAVARARVRAADLAMVTGQLEEAREQLRQAHDAFRSLGSPQIFEALCEFGWALVAASTGDFVGAARALEQPLEIRATVPDSFLVPHALGCAALVLAHTGDPSAVRLGAEAVAAARRFPVPQILVMALARAAEAGVLSGRSADVRPLVVELVDTLRHLGARRWVAEAYELAAMVFDGDQPDMAAIVLGAADRLRAALGEPSGPAPLLGQALDAARQRILAALGPDEFSMQKATGAGLPVDEALALVANRLRDGQKDA